jgi:hypothetical protein
MRDFVCQGPAGVASSYTLLLGLLRFLSLSWCTHPPRKRTGRCSSCTIREKALGDDLDRCGSAAAQGERKLVDNGRSDRVLQLRHDYQLTMRDNLIAVVERQLYRKVIAFMSQNHIDPDLAVEVFVLEPDQSGLAKRRPPESS